MEKLRITVDDLQVQSFATTAPDAQQRGTVDGHDGPSDRDVCDTAYAWWETCATWGFETCDMCTDGPTAACSVDLRPSGC